jgi:PST family polysaccharide transporter
MRSVALNVFAAKGMMFAGGQMPRLILGYTLGPQLLGLFILASRILDIITNTLLFPRVVVGRIELRDAPPASAEFHRRFASVVQDIGLMSFPVLLGAAALMPDLIRVWLDPRWLDAIVPAQLMMLSALPLVYSYSLDAAFLAINLSGTFRRMATIQAVTVFLTVLGAAPFGLNAVCLALAVRPWLVLPFFLQWLGQQCQLSVLQVLRLPFRPLLGALIMTAVVSLPILHASWLDEKINFILLIAAGAAVYGAFLYGFCRAQLTAALAGMITHRL